MLYREVIVFVLRDIQITKKLLSDSPRLWLKRNRLLRLGRPVGAVTLPWWEWWWSERWIWGARGGALNLISTNYPDHGHHGRLPLSRKNAHGRAGNRTRDLMVSSQELWPPSNEAGRLRKDLKFSKSLHPIFFLSTTGKIFDRIMLQYAKET